MNLKKINKKKIFVTGFTGSGKSTFAKKYGETFNIPYISFDDNWSYGGNTMKNQEKIIKLYGDEFITDAIPFALDDDNKFMFLDYYNEHKEDIKIVCVYTTDSNELKKRRPNFGITDLVEHYYNFYGETVELFKTFPDVDIEYYDSVRNVFVTYDEFTSQVRSYLKSHFRQYLNSLTYDKNYGAIECIQFPGYTNSINTWNRIKDLVDWKDKKVADLGCFHGYFAFKASQAGAKVTGLDRSPIVLQTTRIINYIEGKPLELRIWEGGEEVSDDFDVVLALNVIHHFADLPKALANIKPKTVIFEVNQDNVPAILKEFKIIREVKSHRHSVEGPQFPRKILLCEKK